MDFASISMNGNGKQNTWYGYVKNEMIKERIYLDGAREKKQKSKSKIIIIKQ